MGVYSLVGSCSFLYSSTGRDRIQPTCLGNARVRPTGRGKIPFSLLENDRGDGKARIWNIIQAVGCGKALEIPFRGMPDVFIFLEKTLALYQGLYF
jgi:hypothetical protein